MRRFPGKVFILGWLRKMGDLVVIYSCGNKVLGSVDHTLYEFAEYDYYLIKQVLENINDY